MHIYSFLDMVVSQFQGFLKLPPVSSVQELPPYLTELASFIDTHQQKLLAQAIKMADAEPVEAQRMALKALVFLGRAKEREEVENFVRDHACDSEVTLRNPSFSYPQSKWVRYNYKTYHVVISPYTVTITKDP